MDVKYFKLLSGCWSYPRYYAGRDLDSIKEAAYLATNGEFIDFEEISIDKVPLWTHVEVVGMSLNESAAIVKRHYSMPPSIKAYAEKIFNLEGVEYKSVLATGFRHNDCYRLIVAESSNVLGSMTVEHKQVLVRLLAHKVDNEFIVLGYSDLGKILIYGNHE